MSHSHFILKCKCGAVIAQCRCMDGNKRIETSETPCSTCRLSGERPK